MSFEIIQILNFFIIGSLLLYAPYQEKDIRLLCKIAGWGGIILGAVKTVAIFLIGLYFFTK